MSERVLVIVGAKPDNGILVDLPHPGSKPDKETGKIPLAKFMLAKVDERYELFELIVFEGHGKGACLLLHDRISQDGKVYTLVKFDMTFMLHLLLEVSPEKFQMLDTLISSVCEKYADFRKKVPDLMERLQPICESKDVGMGAPLLRFSEEKYRDWIKAKHKKVCDHVQEKQMRLPECSTQRCAVAGGQDDTAAMEIHEPSLRQMALDLILCFYIPASRETQVREWLELIEKIKPLPPPRHFASPAINERKSDQPKKRKAPEKKIKVEAGNQNIMNFFKKKKAA